MVRCLFILLVVSGLNACTLIENIVESLPYKKTRECCYINGSKDTVFFDCKRQKTKKLEVSIATGTSYKDLFTWDTIIGNCNEIPLTFIYNKIPKDSLLNKYFHLIVVQMPGCITIIGLF